MLVENKLDRGALLKRAGVGLGAAAVAGAVPTAALGAHVTPVEAEALNLLLRVNRLEAAFYADAVAKGKLTGRLLGFARVAAVQERTHVRHLARLVGHEAEAPQRYDFKTATTDAKAFAEAARTLEDLAVQAAVGQSIRFSNRRTLSQLTWLLAVDARHAGWIRSIIGGTGEASPSPDALENSRGKASIERGLEALGFITQ